MHEYPLMLYKAGGSMFEWDGEMFDHLVIEPGDNAEAETSAALKDGWSVGKPKGKSKAADRKDD
jgi:hypothetical protein